jgi:predicted adenine nucleotide alpha hydrolase (AANH) superfamily ATPase
MKVLLHICCSNCAIYPFKLLKEEGHEFTGFWFNPNIHPLEEYSSRLDSLKTLATKENIAVIYNEAYTPEDYFSLFGMKSDGSSVSEDIDIPTFPERCRACYRLRLEQTAEYAKEHGFEAFSTTLLISPYQDFEGIVDTGNILAEKYGLHFHLKDYRPYFRDAMTRSKELGLYRQNYCGCIFSKNERKKKKAKNNDEKPQTHRP